MSKTQQERREYWRQVVRRQEQSGQSIRSFCRQHGTNEHSFYQWRKRLAAELPVKFALVETNPGARIHAEAVEMILSSGDRVRITPGVDAATLRLALSVLREPR